MEMRIVYGFKPHATFCLLNTLAIGWVKTCEGFKQVEAELGGSLFSSYKNETKKISLSLFLAFAL